MNAEQVRQRHVRVDLYRLGRVAAGAVEDRDSSPHDDPLVRRL
jgi:hypothetical protein